MPALGDVAPPSPDGRVLVDLEAGVATLTLDRPARLNALDAPLRRRLLAELERVAGDDTVRAVVLTGAGRAFSSGSDISTFEAGDSRSVLLTEYAPIVTALRSMAKPVLAAVNGVAAGAGASLALACDLVVIGASGRFELSFIRLGLVPDAGLTWNLVRAVGRVRAAEVSWTGAPIHAEDALAWGLVNRVVADGEERAAAHALARELAAGPSAAIAASKRLIDEATTADFAAMLEREADVQGDLRAGPEHAERLGAWFARHPKRR